MAQTSLFNRCRDSGSLAGREGKAKSTAVSFNFAFFLAFSFFFFNTEILLICILCVGAVDTEAKLF